MKQTQMFAKVKPRFCNWVLLRTEKTVLKLCNEPAVVMIHKAAYCPIHAEQAQKMFGAGKPITT